MTIVLFEDHHWRNFSPITLTRATFDVKVGARTYFEEYTFGDRPPSGLLVREHLAKVTGERHGGCKVNGPADSDSIFVNGLVHPAALDLEGLKNAKQTFAMTSEGRLVVARLGKKAAEYLAGCVAAGKPVVVKKLGVDKLVDLGSGLGGLLAEPWDIIRVLENSLSMQTVAGQAGQPAGAKVLGTGSTAVEGAQIEEGTVIDTRKGSVYIGAGASVAPCRIVGPAYIGPQTQVKQFSIIAASYVGRNCRVAGEVEHSVISDCSNKAHAGYVGHSYVGEWVNIGAMTATSDLKMTYGRIRMGRGSAKKDTGLDKLGSFFGDMSKTSIGTMVYGGRRIGVSSHLHGLVAEDVPSFTIYGEGIGARNVELELASAIETQRKMMGRREQSMSKAYEQMIKKVFLATSAERRKVGVRRAKFAL